MHFEHLNVHCGAKDVYRQMFEIRESQDLTLLPSLDCKKTIEAP